MYVYLSKDKETALKVCGRHGRPVLYKVLAKQMVEDGYKIYSSKNGVILTKAVPVKYFLKEE